MLTAVVGFCGSFGQCLSSIQWCCFTTGKQVVSLGKLSSEVALQQLPPLKTEQYVPLKCDTYCYYLQDIIYKVTRKSNRLFETSKYFSMNKTTVF